MKENTKTRYIVVLFVVIIAIIIYNVVPGIKNSNPQYVFWQIKAPTSEKLESAFVLNDYNSWIIGSEGSVFYTPDLGDSLRLIRSRDGTRLISLYFVNPVKGWLLAKTGEVISTSNGGKNWQTIKLAGDNYDFYSIKFFDEQNGVICGNIINESNSQGVLYKTYNGGNNWEENKLYLPGVSCVYFVDADLGYASTDRGLFITRDAGQTWTSLSIENHNRLDRFFFLNKKTGWAAGGESGIFYTIDGGITWVKSITGADYKVADIYFADTEFGWAVGDNGLFLFTLNGGKTWEKLETGGLFNLNKVKIVNSEFGLICGEDGLILKVEKM